MFNFEGSCTHSFCQSGPNWACKTTPVVSAYMPNVVRIICGIIIKGKTLNFTAFQLQHFVVAVQQQSWMQVHNCKPSRIEWCQKCFHIPMPALVVKSLAQSLPFKGITDRQKIQTFFTARHHVKFKPHHTWLGDRRGPYNSCVSETFAFEIWFLH